MYLHYIEHNIYYIELVIRFSVSINTLLLGLQMHFKITKKYNIAWLILLNT